MSHPHRRKTSEWKRRTAIVGRWLHIYLSMVSFAILLFFAVTGITLNHQDAFGGSARTRQFRGKVEQKWVKATDSKDVAKLEIVEFLRRKHNVRSALSDFRVDDSQCSVSFKGPGYSADVFIERETGNYELTETRQGLVAVVNDLHKGRDTGSAWAVIIDVSAALMVLVSLTGLVLIFFLQRRRASGLMAVGIGAALCYLVYLIWVP
jgi:hypothetical protein